MAALGLFTLDTSQLDAGILGGLGTGFVNGSTTSAGTVTGAQGFTGIVTGSTSTAGNVAGLAARNGAVTGTTTTAGTATGAVDALGLVAGQSTSLGLVTGQRAAQGQIEAFTVTTGTASGAPNVTGEVGGATVSAGTATGTPDTPPEPPPVPPTPPVVETAGGPRLFYPQPKPLPQPQPPQLLGGVVRGQSVTTFRTVGVAGYFGAVAHTQTVNGFVRFGMRWPTDEEISNRKRRAIENELLLLGTM